jgi:hypothetical protein
MSLALADAYAARSHRLSQALSQAVAVPTGTVNRRRIDRLFELSRRNGKSWALALKSLPQRGR